MSGYYFQFSLIIILIFAGISQQQELIQQFPLDLSEQWFIDNNWAKASDADYDFFGQCFDIPLLGGIENTRGKSNSYVNTIGQIPAHNKLIVSFSLVLMDVASIEQLSEFNVGLGTSFPGFNLALLWTLDNELRENDPNQVFEVREQCGDGELPEYFIHLEIEFDHTESVFELEIFGTENTTWGISDLTIEHKCDGFVIGSQCFTRERLTFCTEILDNLSPLEVNNPSCINQCEIKFSDDGEIYYEFLVSFIQPFRYDPECFNAQVLFSGVEIFPGEKFFNEYKVDLENQQMSFNIRHKDIVPVYSCEHNFGTTEFTWLCRSSFNLFFGGLRQADYNFKIQVSLDTEQIGTVGPDDPGVPPGPDGERPPTSITVTKNLVDGDCCENQLNILTRLRFCQDITCTSYFEGEKLQIKRGEDVFVEHSIITPEFQDYILSGMSITLGPFDPVVIDRVAGSGKFIYHIKPNVASRNIPIQVVSKINMPVDNRRVLQQQNQGIFEDYTVRDQQIIDVLEDDATDQQDQFGQQQQQEQQQGGASQQQQKITINTQEESYQTTAIIVSILTGVFLLFLVGICYQGQSIKQQKIQYRNILQGQQQQQQLYRK